MALPKEHEYSVDEFEQLINLPENRERLLELINGEIVEKMPAEEHGTASHYRRGVVSFRQTLQAGLCQRGGPSPNAER
jgi:hypothetical protein